MGVKRIKFGRSILLFCGILFWLAGALLKIMHWPFASVFIVVGFGLAALWAIKELLIDK